MHINNIQITGKVNFKLIFSLLFFQHEYLIKYCTFTQQIFQIHRKHSYAGKGVSECLFRAEFNIMTKKGQLLSLFAIFHNYSFSTCHITKTRAYITKLRHRSILMGLNDTY